MTKKEISWILYDVGASAFVLIIVTTFLPIFFKDVAAIGFLTADANFCWSMTISLSSFILIFICPVLGAFADYRGYKKILFIVTSLIGIIFSTALFFVQHDWWFFCLIVFVLAKIGFNSSNVLYDAFLTDVCDRKRVDWISSLGFGLGYIGSIIPFILCIFIIQFPGGFGLNKNMALKIIFPITAFWWLLWALPFLKHVRQKFYIERTERPLRKSIKRLFSTFREIKKYKMAFLFMMAYFLYFDGMNTVMIMCVPYAKDIGITNENMLLVVLFSQIISFPFSILYGYLAKKISAIKMILFGIGIYILVIIGMSLLFLFNEIDIKIKLISVWIIAFLMATSIGGIQALSRSFFCALIPKEKSAEFFGLYNITKYGAVLGPAIIALVTFLTGKNFLAMASISFLMIAGAAILIYIKRRNKNEEYTENLTE